MKKCMNEYLSGQNYNEQGWIKNSLRTRSAQDVFYNFIHFSSKCELDDLDV